MKTDRRDFVMGVAAGIVPLPTQPLWIITENVIESAPIKVDEPGRAAADSRSYLLDNTK